MKKLKFFEALKNNLESCFPGVPNEKEFKISIDVGEKKQVSVHAWKDSHWLFTARFSGTKLGELEIDPYFSMSQLWRDHLAVCLLASQYDEDTEKDPARVNLMFLGSFLEP